MRVANLIFALLFIATVSLAQKPFEGRIVYAIDYDNVPNEMKGLEKMLPSEMVMTIKGTTSRIEQNSVFGGRQVAINRAEEENTIVLVDILEQKLKYSIPKDERKGQKYRVNETDETKEIKGYTCKKATLQTSTGIVLEVWYTDEFQNPDGTEFPQIKGLPLEYEIAQKGMTLNFAARSVKEEAIDETYFAIPAEYEETSLELFNQMIRQ